MKKWCLILTAVLLMTITSVSCRSEERATSNNEVSDSIASANTLPVTVIESSTSTADEITDDNKSIASPAITAEIPNEDEPDIVALYDIADEWSKAVLNEGCLTADFNRDGKDDTLQIEYAEIEGSKYIARFELTLADTAVSFSISNYDAHFQKMKLYDFDKDGADELVIMFDTLGVGGAGSHEVYVLWLKSDGIIAKQMNYPETRSIVDIEPDWSIDDIYDIEKVKYKGDSKFLVRQYVWGEGGHADGVGALESIVSYDATNNTFIVEEAWLVLWQRNAYDMRTD